MGLFTLRPLESGAPGDARDGGNGDGTSRCSGETRSGQTVKESVGYRLSNGSGIFEARHPADGASIDRRGVSATLYGVCAKPISKEADGSWRGSRRQHSAMAQAFHERLRRTTARRRSGRRVEDAKLFSRRRPDRRRRSCAPASLAVNRYARSAGKRRLGFIASTYIDTGHHESSARACATNSPPDSQSLHSEVGLPPYLVVSVLPPIQHLGRTAH